MGIRRIATAVFLVGILTLGFGEGTDTTGKPSGKGGAAEPKSVDEARQRLLEYEKAYLEKKCITSGRCGKETGKVCAVGTCCTKEGYCWPDTSDPCDPLARPQIDYSGENCTDKNEREKYVEGLKQYDQLVAGGGTSEGKVTTLEEAKKAYEAAKAAIPKDLVCITSGKCGEETGKICAGQKCCTKWGYCWPKESDQCVPEKEFQLKYSWPFCSETVAYDKYLKAKETYNKLAGGKK